jgi:hypothetical protein
MTPDLKEGDRVIVFDAQLWHEPEASALDAYKPATIVRRYSETSKHSGYHYPDLIDVVFDHRPEKVSKGHFTTGVEKLA